MHDLRTKVLLQSGKTMSRKARSHAESSRASSVNHTPNTSPGGSRVNSRPASHYGSDDDRSVSSDDDIMTASVHSDDDFANSKPGDTWSDRLRSRVTDLLARKGTSSESRAGTMKAYVHLMRYHYAEDEISPYLGEIMMSLRRNISEDSSTEEKIQGLQALTITCITSGPPTAYTQLYSSVEKLCEDPQETVKTEAIWALAACAAFGGGGSAAYQELCQYFLDIIVSDGETIQALDSGSVVTTALQAWAFLASYLPDLHEQADEPLDAFMNQLESTDPSVQAEAASNIAQLFEAIQKHKNDEDDEDVPDPFQRERHLIMERLKEIQKDSVKSVSRKNRQNVRSTFKSVITSLEKGKGPGYSTAGRQGANPHKGSGGVRGGEKHGDTLFREYGYREKIRIGGDVMIIDAWDLAARAEALRVFLRGGFSEHMLENDLVRDIFMAAEFRHVPTSSSRKGKGSKSSGDDEGHYSGKPPKNWVADLSD